MTSAYKWKPLLAGTLGHSVNPETIHRNKYRANLSHVETAFEHAWANAFDDETKAEVDQEMIVGENEILEPLIDWVNSVEWLLLNAEGYEKWEEDGEYQDVDFINLYEPEEEDDNGLKDSDEIYGAEKIYEREEEEEVMEDDGDNDQNDNYQWNGEQEHSSHNLNQSHSISSTRGLYVHAAENCFWGSTQEIGERLLGWAMTPKDFLISPEDQQDRMEDIITKRTRLFAGNAHLIIDLEKAARDDTEE
ncbi:hypothetical protein B9Z19DRAFT_1125531 [Tuber borchii]|uniref:Uncharacterized protein n=1 Tax=Tuber borchii TaxID=42251 RepID=A0A2T6ZUV0_TUBBO|nr:hypothetical protein B9Z19DRAFT_1125531 [Tuber borchii]